MNIRLLVAALLLAASPVAAQAGDIAMPQIGSGDFYVQVLGGAIAPSNIEFWESGLHDDFFYGRTGYAIAGTVGVIVLDNLAIEGDVLLTSRQGPYEYDAALDTVTTASAMVNAKAFLPLADMFTLYGAAGVGVIQTTTGWQAYNGLGYQVIGGASAAVSDNVAIVGELRLQDTFGTATGVDYSYETLKGPTMTALVGVKLGF